MILWLSKILLPFVISYVIAFGLISWMAQKMV